MKKPKPKKRATSRRAPHMEKYVKVERYAKGWWRVRLSVGPQTFTLDYANASKSEALWMRDMLCIALDAIVKDQKP